MKRLWEKYSGIRPWFWFFGYLLVFPDLTIWIANCRGLHMFDLENLLIAALLTVSGLFLFAVFGCFGSPRFGRTVMLAAWMLAGTFHLTCEGEASWYDFAREIFRQRGIEQKVTPCTTAEFPRPAPRPANSRLEKRMLRLCGLPPMPEWREALAEFLKSGL